MLRPKIFTAEFWTRRIDALTDNLPRMWRTGAQAALLAVGQDVVQVDWFRADITVLAKAFAGGCIAWIITTTIAPPRS